MVQSLDQEVQLFCIIHCSCKSQNFCSNLCIILHYSGCQLVASYQFIFSACMPHQGWAYDAIVTRLVHSTHAHVVAISGLIYFTLCPKQGRQQVAWLQFHWVLRVDKTCNLCLKGGPACKRVNQSVSAHKESYNYNACLHMANHKLKFHWVLFVDKTCNLCLKGRLHV